MKRIVLLLACICLLVPTPVHAQEENPWPEIFLPNGDLNPDLIDLGTITQNPDWMSLELPFGQSIDLEVNYHRYQTPDGDIIILPSVSTLFFMAMNPLESGLIQSDGSMSNGLGSLTGLLGLIVGDYLDWEKVQADHPEYSNPDQFWGDVLSGEQKVWTYFSGWQFITNLLQMSWNDGAVRSMYLIYLNGSQNCAAIPGGCSGVVTPPEPARECPDPTVSIQQPSLSIQKTGPDYPLVVGQDTTNRRGADIEIEVTIPPVIFTWYEPIYEERDICRYANTEEIPNCTTGSESTTWDGVMDTVLVFIECRMHVEHLPDAVASIQASAVLDAASRDWITGKLGQTHYEAYIHQPGFSLIPGLGTWSGGCDQTGICSAAGLTLQVPFADPGTFNLQLNVVTKGTNFQGIPITQPRYLSTEGTLKIYVTLPALVL